MKLEGDPLPELNLADSNVLGFSRERQQLVVRIQQWNENQIRLVFSGVLSMGEASAGEIQQITESKSGEWWDKTVGAFADCPPSDSDYSLYSLMDDENRAVLVVVAKGLSLA